ncbi:MAG TPA: diacylglycerol kinase family protein [Tepidisphaeraceae bacterium]|jgi:diacylglycerol kinase family enzyme|nr:diacylglycerol kinase family protein [Tepidisphaeraceae bacterium]
MRPRPTILVFCNPNAGRGRARSFAGKIARRLQPAGYDVRTVFEPPGQFLPKPAATHHAAIVMGGDGTLRAVAARLYEVLPEPPPILLVPMGTANLIGKHLELAWHDEDPADEIAAAIAKYRVVHFDAGSANGQMFLLMASAGFDAHVVHEMERVRNGPIDFISYAFPTLLTLRDYAFHPLRVAVDGRPIFDERPAIAIVANVPEYGMGFPFLPDARPNDRRLDVCVMPCRDRKDLLQIALLAAAGEHLQADGVVLAGGTRIEIESSEQTPIQLDGDAFGFTPLRIDLLERRVGFIVP